MVGRHSKMINKGMLNPIRKRMDAKSARAREIAPAVNENSNIHIPGAEMKRNLYTQTNNVIALNRMTGMVFNR